MPCPHHSGTTEETTDRIDAATRLNRQHAWDAFEPTAGTGNTVQPAASVFLMLDYEGEGPPAVSIPTPSGSGRPSR